MCLFGSLCWCACVSTVCLLVCGCVWVCLCAPRHACVCLRVCVVEPRKRGKHWAAEPCEGGGSGAQRFISKAAFAPALKKGRLKGGHTGLWNGNFEEAEKLECSSEAFQAPGQGSWLWRAGEKPWPGRAQQQQRVFLNQSPQTWLSCPLFYTSCPKVCPTYSA